MDNFVLIGINYKNGNLTEREQFIKDHPEEILQSLTQDGLIDGYVLLITCLRIEFYFRLMPDRSINEIIDQIRLFRDKLYIKSGKEAVSHLFGLSCGLDSIIAGEDQILSQIKNAYFKALEAKQTTGMMNKIFNAAIAVGKKFRSVSKVTAHALSLERIAVNFIKTHFTSITDKKVFIIGTGKLSRLILSVLQKEGVQNLTVTNRTTHTIPAFVHDFKVKTVSFERKYTVINESDIIISATSAPHLIIKHEDLSAVLTVEKNRFFLDIAVPRDIDERINSINGISLYNIDDLWAASKNNLAERNKICGQYTYLIEEETALLMKWLKNRELILNTEH